MRDKVPGLVLVVITLAALYFLLNWMDFRGGIGGICRPDGTCQADLVCTRYRHLTYGPFHYSCQAPADAREVTSHPDNYR